MTEYIATTDTLRVGSTHYLPADAFDPDALIKRGSLTERTIEALKRQKLIVPLNRDNFAVAVARRPAGSPPPAGFTSAYLIDRGIIDAPLERATPRNPGAAAVAPERIEKISLTDESVQVGRYYRTPEKRGIRKCWVVTDAHGRLMRSKAFAKADAADEFISALESESTGDESSDNAGGEEERSDDLHVQSDADGHVEPGEVQTG